MKFPMAACSKGNLPLSAPLIEKVKEFSVDTEETILSFKLNHLWRNNLPPVEEWEGDWDGVQGKWIRHWYEGDGGYWGDWISYWYDDVDGGYWGDWHRHWHKGDEGYWGNWVKIS